MTALHVFHVDPGLGPVSLVFITVVSIAYAAWVHRRLP